VVVVTEFVPGHESPFIYSHRQPINMEKPGKTSSRQRHCITAVERQLHTQCLMFPYLHTLRVYLVSGRFHRLRVVERHRPSNVKIKPKIIIHFILFILYEKITGNSQKSSYKIFITSMGGPARTSPISNIKNWLFLMANITYSLYSLYYISHCVTLKSKHLV